MEKTAQEFRNDYREFVRLNEEYFKEKDRNSCYYDTVEKIDKRFSNSVYVTRIEMEIICTQSRGISTIVRYETLPYQHVKYDAHNRPRFDFCKTFAPEKNKFILTGANYAPYKQPTWCAIALNSNLDLLTLLLTEEREFKGKLVINGKEGFEYKDFRPIRVLDVDDMVGILLLNGFDINVETETIFQKDMCYWDTDGMKINIVAERPYKIEKSYYDIADAIFDFWDYHGTNAEEISIVEVDGLLYFELSDKREGDEDYNLSYGVMYKDFIIAEDLVPINSHLYEQRIYEKNCKNEIHYKIDDFLKNVYKEKKFEE